jgi:hypothetical protein
VIRLGIAAALTLVVVPVAAVCVNGFPSVEDEYKQSDMVFIGHVVSEEPEPEDPPRYLEGTTYTVRVDEVLRGKPSPTLRLFSENSSGRFPMEVGGKYLLFLHRDPRERDGVDNCGNSGLVAERAEALQTVQRLRSKRQPEGASKRTTY